MEILAIGLALVFYFIPTIAASSRDHNSATAIFILNLFLGWSIIGWLAALIWAFTGNVAEETAAPTRDTRIKCPDCAELVQREARVCKHCGKRMAEIEESPAVSAHDAPIEGSTEAMMARIGITKDGATFTYKGFRYDRLEDAIAYAKKQTGN